MTSRRQQSRVQGGWATSSRSTNKQTVSSSSRTQQPEGVSVQYVQNSKVKMPSRRPANFSWVIEGLLAGSAFPQEGGHFQYYLDHNIKTLVTLTEWKPPMQYAPKELKNLCLPIEEFEAPSIEQLLEFCNIVLDALAKEEAVCAHCYWGRGRTGTMLAAYLIYAQKISPQEAISTIRNKRPYSIETYEQEEILWDLSDYLEKKHAEEERERKERDKEGKPSIHSGASVSE